MLDLDWLALGVAVKYQLPLDNSPQSTLMWKRHQAFSTHRRTLMSERLIKTPIRYYFIIIDLGILMFILANEPEDKEVYINTEAEITKNCIPVTGVADYDGKVIINSMHFK